MAGRIDSSSVIVWYHTANVLKDQGKYEEAIKFYKRVVEATAQGICFPCASNNLGWTYSQLNQYEKAEKYYKKAIQIDSTFTLAYENLGTVYFKSGRPKEAEAVLNKIKIDSTNVNATHQLGKAYHLSGFYEKAEKIYQRAIQIDPTFIMNYYQLACLQSLQNNVDSAFAGLEAALEKGMKDYGLLQTDSDLAPLRERKKQWGELMQKYFPEQVKD